MNGLAIGGVSLATIFSIAFVATLVLFLIYVADWAENDSAETFSDSEQSNRYYKAQISYWAGVIILLFLLTGMHSFVIAKELL